MSNLSELKIDLADEAIRPNLRFSPALVRFIRQASQRINREIRVSDMERRARAEGNGTNYMPSPAGFLEMRRLWYVANGTTTDIGRRSIRNALTQVSPQALLRYRSGGKFPKYFAVGRGEPPEIEFDVPISDELELEMIYMKAYDYLVDNADTNWLLDNAYDLYFEGSLFYLYKHDRNNEEAQFRAAAYQSAKAELEAAERRQAYMQPLYATAGHNVV